MLIFKTLTARGQNMAALSIAILGGLVILDYATGHELVFSAAYLIPVSLAAWHCSRSIVWILSIACSIITLAMDHVEGHSYSHLFYHYWKSFSCLVISLTTGHLLGRLRDTLRERKQANDDLQRALRELQASTEEIRQLQNGLQVVCAWTKQIKVGEEWMSPDEFLSSRLHLNLTHGISPEAYQELAKQWMKPGAQSA
ncbi:hypothetical protein SAMN02745166_02704 [Prosthecobacter debontii]|uniref:Uncharacterized protein n=1 Tax=Prosthecobacter debontii TaxID=48467 RepID=A0A1T4YAA1_9BACT|nr:hypothetical protein [Prosthecobacter debontii]SKA98195.1 hypothetical protein SAMN02745166_02704 [Prosthecobacter debontii]